MDYAIAKSIIDLHMGNDPQVMAPKIYDVDDIRRYIAFARCFKPKVSFIARENVIAVMTNDVFPYFIF